MSFNDLPKIDDNARNGELAETKFRQLFSMANKFICRQDVPDKGCDFDVELVVSENSASNRRFPVQVKSVKTPKFILNKSILSYSFETSRLNYLLQRPFASGLVVIYSIEEDLFYYEFADRLFEDINSRYESDKWRLQEEVSLHISIDNILNAESLATIHKVFSLRFERAANLQLSQDGGHDLPIVSIKNTDKRYNFNNIDDIIAFVDEYGLYLLNAYNLKPLYAAFQKLPYVSFSENPDILLIAMIVFGEVGELAESVFFASKLKKYLPLSEELMISYEFSLIKNEYNLGYLEPSQYVDRLSRVNMNKISIADQAIVSINLARSKIIELKYFDDDRQLIVQDVLDNFLLIDTIPEEDGRKYFMKLWNIENYSMIVEANHQKAVSDLHYATTTGNKVPNSYRLQIEKKGRKDRDFINKTLFEISKIANAAGNKHLNASAHDIFISNFINHQVTLLLDSGTVKNDVDNQYLEHIYQIAAEVYESFQDLCMHKNAFIALHHCHEIIRLIEYHFPGTVPQDAIAQILETEAVYERELDHPKISSLVDETISKVKEMNNPNPDLEPIRSLTDEQVLHFSQRILEILQLPEERLGNIIADQKAIRLYYQRCQDEGLLITRIPDFEPADAYKTRVRYKLKNMKTAIETPIHHDMTYLLTLAGYGQ